MEANLVTGGAVGALLVFCGLMVRLLWHADDKWVKIIDSKDITLLQFEKRVKELETENWAHEKTISVCRRDSEACIRRCDDLEHTVEVLERQLHDAHVLPSRDDNPRTRSTDGHDRNT